VAATPEAHRGLVGYLASLRDQVQEMHYAAPADNGWLALLATPQNLRPGAEIGLRRGEHRLPAQVKGRSGRPSGRP